MEVKFYFPLCVFPFYLITRDLKSNKKNVHETTIYTLPVIFINLLLIQPETEKTI